MQYIYKHIITEFQQNVAFINTITMHLHIVYTIYIQLLRIGDQRNNA